MYEVALNYNDLIIILFICRMTRDNSITYLYKQILMMTSQGSHYDRTLQVCKFLEDRCVQESVITRFPEQKVRCTPGMYFTLRHATCKKKTVLVKIILLLFTIQMYSCTSVALSGRIGFNVLENTTLI